ncbi:MAG: TIR domain-containing protein, partial [Actinomycetota bacterium]|nr:TIR domain-containing protein [Actinomycetota bacterium]
MASLFISHSSVDDESAKQLGDRLREAKHASFFLDHDVSAGIAPGRRWEDELYTNLRRCDAVIFLATESSVTSPWCFAELVVARSIGKPIVPIGLRGVRLSLLEDVQWIDWEQEDPSWARLWRRLEELDIEALPPFDPTRPPYPGLDAFDEADARVFFGRSAEIREVRELLYPPQARDPKRLVAVTGPSGSGKSSLLRAGLVPRLQASGEWVVVPPLIPGERPLRELALAMARSLTEAGKPVDWRDVLRAVMRDPEELANFALDLVDTLSTSRGRVLFAVDQAEELLRLGDDTRLQFLELLASALEALSSLWLVVTIRPEFLASFLAQPPIVELHPPTKVLLPLDPSRLPEVIKRPAQEAGIDISDEVTNQMVNETEGGDALPLLAYTLRQLYERAGPEKRITAELYDAVGGVHGALKNQADRVLANLAAVASEPEVMETLLQLVTLTPEGQPTRRRVPWDAFEDTRKKILSAFVDARLLKSSQGADGATFVETAHEALFRVWTPLATAIQESEEQLRLRSELDQLAKEWVTRGRLDSYLIGGDRLQRALAFLPSEEGAADLGPIPEYLERSKAYEDMREAQLRTLTESSRLEGLRAELGARADEIHDLLEVRPLDGLVSAIAVLARNQREFPDHIFSSSQDVLRAAIDQARERNVLAGHAATVTAVAMTENLIASASNDGTVRFWSRDGSPLNGGPSTASDRVLTVAISPDGGSVASGSGDGWVRVATIGGEELWAVRGHDDAVTAVSFFGDGRELLTGSDDGTIRRWDANGNPIGVPWAASAERGLTVAFSAATGIVAGVCGDGTVRVWEQDNLRLVRTIDSGWEVVHTCVALSRDGTLLALGGADGQISVFGAADAPIRFKGHDGWVSTMAFSPEGSTLASGGADETIRLWRVDGVPLGPALHGHTDVVTTLSFASDGDMIITGAADRTVRLWDTQGLLLRAVSAHRSDANGVAFLHGGEVIATGGADATLRLWSRQGKLLAAPAPVHENFIRTVAASPHGDTVATGDADGVLVLWDREGRASVVRKAHRRELSSASFSPDGRTIATTGADRTLRFWDGTGELVRTIETGNAEVASLAFAVGGATLATARSDGVVQLFDGEGTLVSTIASEVPRLHGVAVAADGAIAVSGLDGAVRLWLP